jgi:glycerol uptake facilitator-like aquaporin
MEQFDLRRRLAAEALGTAALLAVVIGSGIMGDRLDGGNLALALLGNTLPTGAILVVLILALGPVSGAHFNPAVTLAFAIRREISPGEATLYVIAQVIGGLVGALIAHAMFELPLLQVSETSRAGPAQWFSEWVATFGLVATILGTLRFRPEAVGSFTDTFSGIVPAHAPAFVVAQLIGAATATLMLGWLLRPSSQDRAVAAQPGD